MALGNDLIFNLTDKNNYYLITHVYFGKKYLEFTRLKLGELESKLVLEDWSHN